MDNQLPAHDTYFLPSVVWQCWLDVRKSIQPVKN